MRKTQKEEITQERGEGKKEKTKERKKKDETKEANERTNCQ